MCEWRPRFDRAAHALGAGDRRLHLELVRHRDDRAKYVFHAVDAREREVLHASPRGGENRSPARSFITPCEDGDLRPLIANGFDDSDNGRIGTRGKWKHYRLRLVRDAALQLLRFFTQLGSKGWRDDRGKSTTSRCRPAFNDEDTHGAISESRDPNVR